MQAAGAEVSLPARVSFSPRRTGVANWFGWMGNEGSALGPSQVMLQRVHARRRRRAQIEARSYHSHFTPQLPKEQTLELLRSSNL